MQEKQRCMILFFSIFQACLLSSAGSLLASTKSKNIYCGKNTAIIGWPPSAVTTLQVVRTSFLSPRPRLFTPPSPPVVFFSIKMVFFEQSMQAVSLTSLPSLVFYSFTMFTNLKYNILMFFAPVSLFCCFSIEIWTVAGHVDRPNKFYNVHGSFVTSQNNGYCEEHASILNWQTTNRQLTDTLLTYQWHFVLKVRPYCLVC